MWSLKHSCNNIRQSRMSKVYLTAATLSSSALFSASLSFASILFRWSLRSRSCNSITCNLRINKQIDSEFTSDQAINDCIRISGDNENYQGRGLCLVMLLYLQNTSSFISGFSYNFHRFKFLHDSVNTTGIVEACILAVCWFCYHQMT